MFKRFRSISGDIQSTKHLGAEHLPFASKDLPSQKLFYFSNFKCIPFHVLAMLAIFALLGLMNMYSISLTKGEMYFKKLSVFWLFSLFPLLVTFIINLRYFLKFSYFFYILAVVSLGSIFIIGDVTMGARRWIDFGFMKIQPLEFAKIAVVFALARYYHFVKSFNMHSLINAGIAFCIAAIPAGLIMMQPDLGSGLVIIFITLLVIFVNGIRWSWLIIAFVGFCALMPVVWSKLHDYQKDRILTFINPESDPHGAGYNVIQSKIAIGSGGLVGKGYTQNDQSSLQFLPENQTDFAFTVFAEEFGFLGCVLFICCFVYLVMYGNIVAQRSKSYFGKMLAFGVSSLLFIHICINLMMIMGLLPVVGIPLPFVSYGGSSLMLCVFCVAILVNVDIHRNIVIQSSINTYMLK